MFRPSRKTRPGFALVELLVLLGVGAFLLGLLLPAVQKGNEAASRARCQNNLRQLAIAMHNAADVNGGNLPPIAGPYPAAKKNYGTYWFHLLPYIEQSNLRDRAKNFVWKNGVYSTPIETLLCPSDEYAPENNTFKKWLATTNYAANWLIFRTGGARMPASFPDGTSNTIVYTERYQVCKGTPCAWGYPGIYYWSPMFARYSEGRFQPNPAAEACDPTRPQSPHEGGINAALGDGSVRFVNANISPQTWWYACTPDGGEVLGSDW
jgi:type II secretory pathway pseudopilin PulG